MKCDGEEAKRQYKIQNKRGVDVDGDLYKDNPDRGQGMDEAYQKIIDAFDGFSSPATMSRCTRLQNTNINALLRLWWHQMQIQPYCHILDQEVHS